MLAEYSGPLLGYRWTVSAKRAANTFQTVTFQAARECVFLPRTPFCFQGTRWEEDVAENTNAKRFGRGGYCISSSFLPTLLP